MWARGKRLHLETYRGVKNPQTQEAGVTAGCKIIMKGVQNQGNWYPSMEISETIKELHLRDSSTSADLLGLYRFPSPQSPKKPPSQIRTMPSLLSPYPTLPPSRTPTLCKQNEVWEQVNRSSKSRDRTHQHSSSPSHWSRRRGKIK